MPAVALEVEHGIDHVLDDLWPGDLSVLGHVADEQHGAARHLGITDERLRRGAHLADGAGRGVERVGPKRLDGIDDDEIGRRVSSASVARMLERLVSRGEADRRVREAQALGAEPHLRDGFFAGEVDARAAPRGRDAAASWSSSVDLPMPGSPPIRMRGARHDAAARDAVEFGDAGREARRFVRRALEAFRA